jgi:phosphinothricin acetyltransferase
MTRLAAIQDLPAITDIYNEAIRNTTATFDTEPKTIEARRPWFTERPRRYPVIVVEDQGRVAGWASLSAWSDKKGYADTVEISLYVSPRFQGRGFGKQLMTTLLELGRQHGIHLVIARIADGNEASVRLHKAFGFELAGVLKEAGKKFNRLIDVHMYQLILR